MPEPIHMTQICPHCHRNTAPIGFLCDPCTQQREIERQQAELIRQHIRDLFETL